MTATALTPVVPVGPYPSLPVGATTLDLTETVADPGNGNSFVPTGKEVLLIHNTDASPHTVTITSAADDLKRTGDITTYSVGAGKISCFNFAQLAAIAGWRGSGGTVVVTANDATVKFVVLRLP